jgi:para-aminobenzoate synthetase component I
MVDLSGIAGQCCTMDIEPIEINEPFIDLAERFSSMPGTVLLMSGGYLDSSRYHILGIRPWLTLKGRGRRMTVSSDSITKVFDADPFEVLRSILNTYRIDMPKINLPLVSGLMGYLAYDLKDHIERLPRTSVDDLGLPGICLFAPSMILVHDKLENDTWLCVRCTASEEKATLLDEFNSVLERPLNEKRRHLTFTGDFRPNMTRSEYYSSIKKIREYIASGDVYQVNFAQRFEADFSGAPFGLFRHYYDENPAPFFAFINAGDHQIVSTSPERFIFKNGNMVETRPIKGTRPRGKDGESDQALKRDLEESEKDQAELSMIVDLMRNDLGKVCECGSVSVLHHKKLEQYENVHHMVSVVGGKLDPGYDSVDLVKATFPGGSITGCPKVRAMEIIDELEPNRRHVYTGSIGYLSFHDTMDLSIAIRTATVFNDKMFVSFGGGIVYDSKPSKEYDETLRKGKTFLNAKKIKKPAATSEMAWINGAIKPLDRACVRVSDLGFQYGHGFFETIRFAGGVPCYLDEHIARFNLTWKELFRTECSDLSWREIIQQVIDANRLKDENAAVKIIASWGMRKSPPFDQTLVVTAKRYTHRLSGRSADGLSLITYPNPRQTPLADYKSLNYLYYYLAGRWAQEHGADEALILNPDLTVSETNTANIIAIKGKSILTPASPHVLPGVMKERVLNVLSSWGYDIESKNMKLEDLYSADNVIITNSLLGAAPIKKIDSKVLQNSIDICINLNNVVMFQLI